MAEPRPTIYDSARLAAGYAFRRPPIHHHIVERIGAQLRRTARVGRALDIGCGAGVSTAALGHLAATVVGIDPVAAMLTHHAEVAPLAHFVIGRAEALPFAGGTFDLVAAAGAINYADLDLCLPEIERVLAPRGVLAIYDFSAGRRFPDDDRLNEWYAGFERRYPSLPGYDLDVRKLPYARSGLRLDRYDDIEVAVPMDLEAYLGYVMSETNVELAIAHGTPEREIGQWCRATLGPVFGRETHDVQFDAYVAVAARSAESSGTGDAFDDGGSLRRRYGSVTQEASRSMPSSTPNETLEQRIRRLVAEEVAIVEYDPRWPELFRQERAHLLDCLPSALIRRVEHFGSTAVPGLPAKPVIDMLVEVADLEAAKTQIAPLLEAQGYDYLWRPTSGDDGPPFYAWFIKRDPANGVRTHHIHMVEPHFSGHWDRLLFRDYLIAHQDAARAYADLKRRLAAQFPRDRVAYTRGKGEFIDRIMRLVRPREDAPPAR